MAATRWYCALDAGVLAWMRRGYADWTTVTPPPPPPPPDEGAVIGTTLVIPFTIDAAGG